MKDFVRDKKLVVVGLEKGNICYYGICFANLVIQVAKGDLLKQF
jgi:hypothetical protein